MKCAGICRAGIGHGANLGHPVMIENLRVLPVRLQPLAGGWNAATRFTCHEDFPNRCLRQVEPLLHRHLGEMQRVGGSAAEHGGLMIDQHAEPRHGAEPAAGQGEAAESSGRLEGGPETEEGTEREGEEHPIVPGDARSLKNPGPVSEHPVPALGGVQPADRCPYASAGLVTSYVTAPRISQIGPVGRMGLLVGHDLRLCGEGDVSEEGVQGGGGGARLNRRELRAVERIACADGGHQLPQRGELMSLNRGTVRMGGHALGLAGTADPAEAAGFGAGLSGR